MAGHEGNGDHGGDVPGADDDVIEVGDARGPSDEQPVVVFGVEDSDDALPALGDGDERLPDPDLPTGGDSDLAGAYAGLELRTPPAELEAFARGRVEALARAGQVDRAALAGDALAMAQVALRRVMGASPREAP
ncbi:MAG: hypothetical protein KF878_04930 [Planctomycetes bacterium]|nr:hypothetical protein [Planctomycetota bacterium]